MIYEALEGNNRKPMLVSGNGQQKGHAQHLLVSDFSKTTQ